MQAAAQSFPEGATRDRYVAAAVNFRPPFWDWAMDPCPTCQVYPAVASQEYVLVDTPTGEQWMLNPLHRYDFHPVSVADFAFAPVSLLELELPQDPELIRNSSPNGILQSATLPVGALLLRVRTISSPLKSPTTKPQCETDYTTS